MTGAHLGVARLSHAVLFLLRLNVFTFCTVGSKCMITQSLGLMYSDAQLSIVWRCMFQCLVLGSSLTSHLSQGLTQCLRWKTPFLWFSVEGTKFHMFWLSAERSFRPLDPCCLFPDIRAQGKHNTIQHTVLTKHNTTHCTQQNIRVEGTHNLSFNVNISPQHQSQC